MSTVRVRVAVVAVLGIVGGCAGLITGFFVRLPEQHEIHDYPLPQHIPKYEGGVSLRFAMVHDVIHERFPRHGEDVSQGLCRGNGIVGWNNQMVE